MASPKYLPDEVQSAISTLKLSLASAMPTREALVRSVAFYAWLFCVGSWLGLASWGLGILSLSQSDFWRSAMTVLSVLTGFMITTMLFTGKADASKSLTFEQLKSFCSKSNYLLVSQFTTLLNHIFCIIMIWLSTAAAQFSGVNIWCDSLLPPLFGFLAVSLLRSVLVPIQIIELHRFTHAALLNEKKKEIGSNLPG